MSSFPYPRLEGTEDFGHEYEHRMTALFSLRFALSENVEEFGIASKVNLNHVGHFDDIVMSVVSNTGDRSAFLIQLKHFENTKRVLKLEDFTYSKNSEEGSRKKHKESFSIEKYWERFQEFEKKYLKSEEHDDTPIINELKKADNNDKIILVLYTNKEVNEVDNDKFLNKHELRADFLDLLDTNDMKYCYGFNLEHEKLQKYDADFLSKCRLFASQLHADEVLNLMKAEIRTFLKLKFPTRVDFNDVVNQYVQYVKTWIKGYQIGEKKMYYTLTKPEVLKILSGILLDSYKYNFSKNHFTSYEDAPKTIWNKIIKDKTITLLNKNDRVIPFIQSYYGSEVRKLIQAPPAVWSELLPRNAVKDFCTKFGHVEVTQVCQNNELSMALIYKTLWMYGTVPLLLDLKESKHFEDVLKILQVCQHSIKVIVLVADISKVKFGKNLYFVTIDDLPPEHREIILRVEVNFQGRLKLPLMNLIDNSMHSIIKCHDVIDILCSEFVIGNTIGEITDYFIDRCLSRVLLRYEVLKIANESFLIEAHDIQIARETLNEFISNNSKINLVSSDKVKKKLQSTQRARHRLKYYKGYLEWVESIGDISNLRDYQVEFHEDKYEVLQPENLDSCFSIKQIWKTCIISDCAGMGKSTLMDFVASKAPSELWVLKIKLTDMAVSKVSIKSKDNRCNEKSKLESHHPQYSDSSLSDSDSDSFSDDHDILSKHFNIMDYFDSIITEERKIETSQISLAVFHKLYSANKILILLDGFDEISISYKDKVTEIIKKLKNEQRRVWVTTRDHLKVHLEDTLGVLALTIKPFTQLEQETFLINFFEANIKTTNNKTMVAKFVDRLLIAAKKNLSGRDSEFTGVPLQTQLLAESFLKHCEKSCRDNEIKLNEKFDLLKLYEKFVKIKNKILAVKSGADETMLSRGVNLEKAQQYFALIKVFGEESVRKLNVMEHLERCYDYIKCQILQRDGILIIRGSKSGFHVDFIHQTFAEYFVAKFLSENFSSKDSNVLSLIEKRFSLRYEFVFRIFDRILAKEHPLHLYYNIIDLEIPEIHCQMQQNPKDFLKTDKFNRSGLHMLILYDTEIPKNGKPTISYIDLDSFDRLLEKFEASHLMMTDYSGLSVLDYCFLLDNWKFAAALCRKALKLPLRLPITDYPLKILADRRNLHIFRTLFYNFIVRDLLTGRIYEDTSISCYTLEIMYSNLIYNYKSMERFKLITKPEPDVVTVSDYLKKIGIKDSKNSYYNDIRFAIALGSKPKVEELLASKEIDVNKPDDSTGYTFLHYASYNRRVEIFDVLIQRGADINLRDRNGSSVLHILAETGQVHLFEKWLHLIENFDVEDYNSRTPLDYALELNHPESAKILIQKNAKINNIGEEHFLLNENPLYFALKDGFVETAKLLMEHNINLSPHFPHEDVLLLIAKIGNRELFDYFLLEGFDINEQCQGKTPLAVAMQYGHAELVEHISSLILENASNQSASGFTSLHNAAMSNKEDLVISLLERGANIDALTGFFETPIWLALKFGNLKIAEILFDKNANIFLTLWAETNTANRTTPLHIVAKLGHVDLTKKFLDKGAKVNVQDKYGTTPFHLALQNGHNHIVDLLLEHGAYLTIKTTKGNTALHFASSAGNTEIVKKCIQLKIDVNSKSCRGNTPLYNAVNNNQMETAQLLIDNGADIFVQNIGRETLLHAAARSGSDDFIVQMLKLNENENLDLIDALNSNAESPLYIALQNKNLSTAELLLSKGATATKPTFSNLTITMLHLTASIGSKRLLEKILEKNLCYINSKDGDGNSPLKELLLGPPMDEILDAVKLLLTEGATVEAEHLLYLFQMGISKIKTERDLEEVLNFSKEFVSKCSNYINDRNILHDIILSAKERRSGMNECSEKFFEEYLKLLVTSGADIRIRDKQGKQACDLISKDGLNHLSYILKN